MHSLPSAIIGVNAGFPVLSIIAASVRIRRSYIQCGSFQLYDAWLLAALLCGISEAILQCTLVPYGLGSSIDIDTGMDTRTSSTIILFDKLYTTYFVLYFACNMFVKLSLVAFYRKLAPDNRYSWFLLLLDVAAVIFGGASILTALLACVPLSKLWNPALSGKCIDKEAFFYANGSFMIFIDLVLYLTPILIVRRVQLSRSKTMAMNVLFALGFIVIIASVLRLVAIHDLFTHPSVSLYYNGMLLIWCTVENHLALIIVCLPAVKASILSLAPSIGSSSIWSKMRKSSRSTSRIGTPGTGSSKSRNKSWNWDGKPHSRASVVGGKGTRSTEGDEIELRKDVFISTEDDDALSIGCRGDKKAMV